MAPKPGAKRRPSRGRLLIGVALACVLYAFFATSDPAEHRAHHLRPTSRRRAAAPPAPLPLADAIVVPQTAAAAHALPFSIWDAFASERDGCARATIVAQYELSLIHI